MDDNKRTTAVGIFEDRRHATIAVDELRRNGFLLEQIGFVMPEGGSTVEAHPIDHHNKAGEGAAAGAASGVTIGGLVGAALASSIIPGVGPVIAGGILVGIVSGAVAGLASGGLIGSLIGLSVPEEEAIGYEKAFQTGRTVVTVRAEGRYEEAVEILRRVAEGSEEIKLHPGDRASHLSDSHSPSPGSGSVFPGG